MATEPKTETAPKTEAAPKTETIKVDAAPKTARYVVKGADIWTAAGRQVDGSTVELTAPEARHFIKVGLLAPYVEGEDLEG